MTSTTLCQEWQPGEYELIDFGDGRKLERFSGSLFDRPCPAADGRQRSKPQQWRHATARFDRMSMEWSRCDVRRHLPSQSKQVDAVIVRYNATCFQLRCAPSGQLGLFPEQSANWSWLSDLIHRHEKPFKVLNLFAYTGGSTFAAAAAGAEVVHVDASKSAIQWARENARLSQLQEQPIRWIQEDAMKFARREVKRGHRYDGIILDPPTYGHGPKREVWQIEESLPQLLLLCRELTNGSPRLLLLTCHSPGFDSHRLERMCAQLFGDQLPPMSADSLWLSTCEGRRLHCGHFARCARSP